MILNLYINALIILSLITYIVSIVLATVNKDQFTVHAFAYLITIISLSLCTIGLDYAQVHFIVEESTSNDINLRIKFLIQYFYLFFFVLAVSFIERSLFIISFLLFLVYSVGFSRSNNLCSINVINFIILVFYILFFIEEIA
jgi:hypothetical protein